MEQPSIDLFGQVRFDLDNVGQLELGTPADEYASLTAVEEARQSIDDLVREAHRYRSSKGYRNLLRFVSSFHGYAPYNAILVDIQKPGARYVATARRWRDHYGHAVRPNAQPLLILRPRGPVMFVYDVSDVEPLAGAHPLPLDVTAPFEVDFGDRAEVMARLQRLEENVTGLGIRTSRQDMGASLAGHVSIAKSGSALERVWPRRGDRPERVERIPLRYEVVLNRALDESAQLTSLAHELAHVLCGHLGTPEALWWPARGRASHDTREFEAESVAYLVARRVDSTVEMPPYLDQHLQPGGGPPDFSLERVAKVSSDLETMSRRRLPTAMPGKARKS